MQTAIEYETMEASFMECFFVSDVVEAIKVLRSYNPITIVAEEEGTHLSIGRYNSIIWRWFPQ